MDNTKHYTQQNRTSIIGYFAIGVFAAAMGFAGIVMTATPPL